MLKQRVLSALVFVPIFLGIAYLGGLIFDLFLMAVLGFAGFEYASMLKKAGYQVSPVLLIGSILALTLLRMLSSLSVELLAWPVLLAGLAVFALWKFEHADENAFQSLVFQFFGVIYLGFLGAYGISLNHLGSSGNWLVLVTIGLVWLVDAGAYLIGTRFGKTAILPRLSPKKTLEGLVGGTLVGLLAGILIAWVLNGVLPELGLFKGALLGFLLGPTAFFGDALMSLFKRTMGVKDAGKLLPGHGGVLDRLDSMIWATVLGTYFFMIFAL